MAAPHSMNLRLIRRVSIWLIAMLAFAQASVAIASCSMERGSLAPMLEMGEGCGCEAPQVKTDAPQYANRCVAHCTADLQLAGLATALVRSPADAPVLVVPRVELGAVPRTGLESPPPGTVPSRILFHSFLI
jgi:hypothetical protein